MPRSPSSSRTSPEPKRKRGANSQNGPNKRRKPSKAQIAREAQNNALERAEALFQLPTNDARSEMSSVAPSAAPTGQPGVEEDEFQDVANDEDDVLAQNADQELEREELRQGLAVLINEHFTEEQRERYELFRTTGFKPAQIKKLINHVLQQSVSPNVILAFRGLAKVFVGEIIELARSVQVKQGQSGPLQPDHLREAHRLWNKEKEAMGSQRRKLFVR